MENKNIEENEILKKDFTENLDEVKVKDVSKNGLAKAIIVAGILIALAIALPKFQVDSPVGSDLVPDKSSLIFNPVDEDDHKRGSEDPLITIVEFSDFGCHFCGVFHPTMITLVEKYGEHIQWVYRQLPFRDPEGAIAGECVDMLAGDEAFWSFTDDLFADGDLNSSENREKLALDLGISSEDFNSCLGSEEALERVEKDKFEAALLDITATPYSVIRTKFGREIPIRGALPLERMEQIIVSLIEE